MGSILHAQHRGSVRASCAADDDGRAHRESDVDRCLGRWQDLLLLHECQRYRTPPYLGGTCRWRYARADHHGRGRRDIAGSARVRQVPGDAERQLEDAAIAGCMEDGDREIGCRGRSAEDHFPGVAPRLSHGGARETGDRDHQGRRRPRDPQSTIPAKGLETGRAAPRHRLRPRRTGSGR